MPTAEFTRIRCRVDSRRTLRDDPDDRARFIFLRRSYDSGRGQLRNHPEEIANRLHERNGGGG